MKKTLYFAIGLAAASIGSVVVPQQSQAQEYPYCLVWGGQFDGGAENCGFVSFQQCMQARQGIGGLCLANTRYVPPANASPVPQRKNRH